MKRYISRTFIAMLLCAILLPIRVNAAGRDGFQLDNKGVVTLLSQHAAKEKISSLQFSLSVNTAAANTVEFQFAENLARIADFRYDETNRRLNIYVAGAEPLFAEGTSELRIGKVVVLDPSKNEADAEVGVIQNSLGYVYGTVVKLEEDVELPGTLLIGPSAQVTPDPPSPTQEPTEPVSPTEEPVGPTEEPAGPTDQPAEPTKEPTEPTEPTKGPVDPTEKPGGPTEKPAGPTEKPVEPTKKPAGPTDQPVGPTEAPAPTQEPGDTPGEWVTEADGNQYWYEGGVKQGTEGRGKEIYDPASDAWYWLDAVDGGKKAVSKDVYMESAAGPLAENADGTGKWVRYDANGHMVKGWYRSESETWYFDPVFGTMAKGYVVIGGELYWFDRITGIGNGQPCEWQEVYGWVAEEDGNRYWYEGGVKQGTEGRGKEIYDPDSDAWYWLDAVDGGKRAVGKDVYMESLAGSWAENADGTGKWVRYDANGYMVKGWDTTEAGTYYFDPIYGTMAKGYVVIEGKLYWFDKITGIGNGQPCEWREVNGWVAEEDGNCYWYEGGVRQGTEGRGKEIYDPDSDAWYWLDAVDGGKKAVGKDVYMESFAGSWAENADGTGKWVRYDANGHMVKGWDTTEAGTNYFDPIYGTMAKGTVVIEGSEYRFDPITGIQIGKRSRRAENAQKN